MEAKEFGEYLKSVRKAKKMTIRQLELYSKVSNAYISQLERGKRGIPSPEILKKLSQPLGVEYNHLMVLAGHVEKNAKEESEYSLPESEYERIIKEVEAEYGLNLREDPTANKMIREIILGVAKMKAENE